MTARSQESNVDSGWQLDSFDPYVVSGYPVRRFSEGNNLLVTTVDYPSDLLTFASAYHFKDAFYVDDQFWMYVVYFVGDNPGAPRAQRPLGRLRWNWGGLVVFDWSGTSYVHTQRFSNAPASHRTGEPTTSMVAMNGLASRDEGQCPGGSNFTTNHVDSSRVLVREYYSNILGRSPDGSGWDGWTKDIAQCVFDMNCIVTERSTIGAKFLWGFEFRGIAAANGDSIMAAGPDGSPEYNRRFVFWCYNTLLGRPPDAQGWDNATNKLNSTGNYAATIFDIIYSTEYRDERPHF